MPLSVNIGISRKRSENYQSDGLSVNLTAELDQALLARPAELQHQIEELYRQAEQALDRQAAAGVPPKPLQPARLEATGSPRSERRNGFTSRSGGQAGNGHAGIGNGNGHPGNGRHAHAPAATASQRRAIDSICRRLGLDASAESPDRSEPRRPRDTSAGR